LDYSRTVNYALFQKDDEMRHSAAYLDTFTTLTTEMNLTRDDKFDTLWKMRTIFDMLNDAYAKYYSPTEHLAVDEITVLFKGRVVFKQYILKKYKCFGIKVYKFCASKGYTYGMRVYLGKGRTCATETMTATHATVAGLMRRVENAGHKLYMDNFFSSPDLFDNLHSRKINCCGTVRLKRACHRNLERL
jgi:hypothetical protein